MAITANDGKNLANLTVPFVASLERALKLNVLGNTAPLQAIEKGLQTKYGIKTIRELREIQNKITHFLSRFGLSTIQYTVAICDFNLLEANECQSLAFNIIHHLANCYLIYWCSETNAGKFLDLLPLFHQAYSLLGKEIDDETRNRSLQIFKEFSSDGKKSQAVVFLKQFSEQSFKAISEALQHLIKKLPDLPLAQKERKEKQETLSLRQTYLRATTGDTANEETVQALNAELKKAINMDMPAFYSIQEHLRKTIPFLRLESSFVEDDYDLAISNFDPRIATPLELQAFHLVHSLSELVQKNELPKSFLRIYYRIVEQVCKLWRREHHLWNEPKDIFDVLNGCLLELQKLNDPKLQEALVSLQKLITLLPNYDLHSMQLSNATAAPLLLSPNARAVSEVQVASGSQSNVASQPAVLQSRMQTP